MTSFRATARRVRDESLPVSYRRTSLRGCLFHFAPYGFTATWNHLAATHRIGADPSSLVRALDELETTRDLVLSRAAAFAASRRARQRDGQRVPTAYLWNSYGWHAIAYCPDPWKFPVGPLPVVVARVLDAYAAGADPAGRCLVCGDENRRPQHACRNCGVLPGGRSNRA